MVKTFKIKVRDYNRKFVTVIQHKLRVLMKCYTIRDLKIDPDQQTFVFKKSHRINGLTMKDSKEYSGRYDIEGIEGSDNIYFKLTV